jgi:hypothetical protein
LIAATQLYVFAKFVVFILGMIPVFDPGSFTTISAAGFCKSIHTPYSSICGDLIIPSVYSIPADKYSQIGEKYSIVLDFSRKKTTF